MKKRTLSLLLTVALIITMMPQGIVTAKATENSAVTVCVESVSAQPGETVNVNVSIANNPGLLGAGFTVSYDSGITLINAEAGDAFSALVQTKPGNFSSPCNFMWDAQEIKPDAIKDGVFLTLAFQVSEETKTGDAFEVRISPMTGNNIDVDFRPVQIDTASGTISVVSYIPGDLSGDGTVNTIDVILLRRYIAGGYDVNINVEAADVNADGSINTIDIILIRRFIAGGYTNSDGSPLALKPGLKKCDHSFEAIAAKKATCTEDGNIAYWHCTKCGKYFSDAAGTAMISQENTVIKGEHTIVVDPAVPATATTHGLTEGSHCSVCGKVFVAQQETPILENGKHSITYDIANGDTYLEGLLSENKITNNNPDRFSEDSSVTLRNLSVAGYRFLGWYDGAGNNADQIKKINQGTEDDVELYAHWEKIPYTVQLKSDIFLDKSELTYTVDTGAVLPTPKLSNYIFTGWADVNGKLYQETTIPVGSTGNKTLTANWTSERNKAWTKTELDDPLIHIDEDNDAILFIYEIGEMQNVPLYTIKNFGYISGDGVTKTERTTYTTTITDTTMEACAKAVASATTESSSWTLAEQWNETTSVDEQWCQENGYTKEQAETIAKSSTNTWNVSSGRSGSTDTTTLDTREGKWELNGKINGKNTHTATVRDKTYQKFDVGVGLNYTPKSYSASVGVDGVGIGGSVSGGLGWGINVGYSNGKEHEVENTNTSERGWEVSNGLSGSQLHTDSTTTNSSWNSSSSYGGSNTVSASATTSTAVSERISKAYNYGTSYMQGGSSSESQGLSSTRSASDEYSSSVTYSTATSTSVTSEWTTQATKPGYHRWVVAGTAHVFAVVGYDMAEQAYFVYTYSVMDDETHEFEDYSYSSADYNDQQNGVISFKIPFEVSEYVSEFTCYSNGLKVNQTTGIIEEYSGTDNCVIIPEYMNVSNGDVVKVTGISGNAFRGNKSITGVVLSDYITEIPDNAFAGCSSLIGVSGGSITKIGRGAFSGCTSIIDCGITSHVTSIGSNAFEGVNRILVNAANAGVIEASVNSGAKKIVLYMDSIDDTSELSGKTLSVPTDVEYFELYGCGKTYSGLTIVSDADKTVLNKAAFIGEGKIPLQFSSPEVILNQVTVSAPGFALALTADNTNLGLQGVVSTSSNNTNAVLCKNINLYEINPNVLGELNVNDKIFVCGAVTGLDHLRYKQYETIDETMFNRLLHSYTLYFDANEGVCDIASREVANGVPVGALPTPTRDYYSFDGWYLADGKTQVKETTVFSTGEDQTVYAHWTIHPLSGWVPAADAPAYAEIVNNKWTYTLREYTEKSESSLSGWIKYDTRRTSWGATQGPVDSDPSNGSRNVWSEQYISGYGTKQIYVFYWWSSSYNGNPARARIDGYPNYYTMEIDYYPTSTSQRPIAYYNGTIFYRYNGSYWYYCWFDHEYSVEDKTKPQYATHWYYQEPVYTYYYYRDLNKEATNNPTGLPDVFNVQQWVQYRSI